MPLRAPIVSGKLVSFSNANDRTSVVFAFLSSKWLETQLFLGTVHSKEKANRTLSFCFNCYVISSTTFLNQKAKLTKKDLRCRKSRCCNTSTIFCSSNFFNNCYLLGKRQHTKKLSGKVSPLFSPVFSPKKKRKPILFSCFFES